ncbi:PAS domain S-box protein [Bacillus shivajii]|uniref:PAS domain-containing sensor histidine kinase n=1 Tax=Bacillus shivajii TaxID=1983719 RepID=UPI001CFB8759|nr:PAS domain-containing sensor histidine kinase [Bacillus shivajii]UCZ54168.1 PAS domain S-box protein [Bacillus shivajii]
MVNDAQIDWRNEMASFVGEPPENEDFAKCLYLMMNQLSDGVMSIGDNWKITYMNDTAATLLKRNKETLIGKCIWDEYPEAIRTQSYHAYHRVWIEKIALEFEEFDPNTDSYYNIRAFPTNEGITIFFRDVTQHRNATKVIEQSYQSLFDGHSEAVCSLDLEGRLLSVNRAFINLFRTDEKILLGSKFTSFIPKEKLELAEKVFNLAKLGKPNAEEFHMTKHVGKPLTVLVSGIPIIVDSQIIGTYGIIKDITKERLNLEEVHRLYHMNQLIIESVGDGILGLDQKMNVLMWNEAAEKITGYKKEELSEEVLSSFLKTVSFKPLSDLSNEHRHEASLSKDTVVRKTGVTFFRKDGTPYIAEYILTPMISGGEVVGAVLTFRDITEKRKSEEMLHQSEKLSAVGQLAAGIAHEIRNPLTSLKGFLQLIELNSSGKKEYFDIMKSEFARIEQILNELLILSKPQTLKKEPTVIYELLYHTITLLNTQAIIKNIEIEFTSNTKEAKVLCAEHQIKQVFVNLIKNAIEAMEETGEIKVKLNQEKGFAIITVEDQGCGIPKEKLKKIGEPFFTTKEKGTGLGLMVTFQIIEEHGGEVQVDSKEGEGTKFTIRLPLYSV